MFVTISDQTKGMYTSHMVPLTPQETRALLATKLWSVTSLASRWGFSRRYVTAQIANASRSELWNDAFRGLGTGPGLYVRKSSLAGAARVDAAGLQVGALVASEAEMDSFSYGARGVVVELLPLNQYVVVWDGGTVMTIDIACLNEWVCDIGLLSPSFAALEVLSPRERIEAAKMIDLYA